MNYRVSLKDIEEVLEYICNKMTSNEVYTARYFEWFENCDIPSLVPTYEGEYWAKRIYKDFNIIEDGVFLRPDVFKAFYVVWRYIECERLDALEDLIIYLHRKGFYDDEPTAKLYI